MTDFRGEQEEGGVWETLRLGNQPLGEDLVVREETYQGSDLMTF